MPKNIFFLCVITQSFILHKLRSDLKNNKLYITKKTYNKIKEKHKDVFELLDNNNFYKLLEGAIGWKLEENGTHTFLSILQEEFILFAVSTAKHRNEVATVYKLSKRDVKKKTQQGFNLFKESYREVLENYIS